MIIPGKNITESKHQILSRISVDKRGFNFRSFDTSPKISAFILLFLGLTFLLFAGLGSPSIYILDEARNAQCAREMMQNHSLIVPTFNEALRTDKPPLHYYFMIVAYNLMSVSTFSARFFSGVFGLLTVGMTIWFAWKFIGRQSAFLSALVLLCSTHFIFEFRLAVPDPYFIFFTVSGLFTGFTWLKKNQTLFIYLTAILLAFGVLSKGPVAVVLPALALFIFTIYKRSWKTFFTWHLITALLVFLALASPWYLLVHNATDGRWTESFFMQHNFGRYSAPKEGHGGFFLLPLIISLIGLLPFSIFLPELVKKRKKILANDALVFSLLVFAVVVIFFSMSATQLPNYVMPAYPFAAILIGHFLKKLLNQELSSPAYPFYMIAILSFVVPIIVYFVLNFETQTKNETWLALVLVIPALLLTLMVFTLKHLSVAAKIYGLAAISFVFNLLFFLLAYPITYSNNPVSKTLPIVKNAKRVVAYRHYNAGYNFYVNGPIQKFNINQVDSIKMCAPGTLIITCSDHLAELDSLHLKTIAREYDIFEGRETVLLSK